MSNQINIVYALEKPPQEYAKSIFLAGPTPRSSGVQGWRDEAVKILENLGYDGVVYIPIPGDKKWHHEYTDQIEWEQEARAFADIIVFWVPRRVLEIKEGSAQLSMPAFTTNVEFGEDRSSYKMVYGRPDDAEKCDYLDVLYHQTYHELPKATLERTLNRALERIGEGAWRRDGERCIPLHIWKTKHFQKWYQTHTHVGNRLIRAKVLGQFIIPKIHLVFMFQLWVKIWIEKEQRFKENEFILSRTDISVIAAFYRSEKARHDILETEVILIKEFRSPVRNDKCFVYELAGGSAFKNVDNILETAATELYEETGIDVSPEQLVFHGARQLAATWSTHDAHLFSCELTESQYEQARIAVESNKVFGNVGDSERTYIRISTVRELLENTQACPVDWSMLGMICKALLNS